MCLFSRLKLSPDVIQYVKVAMGQRGVMELGGNLPDTLVEHLMVGTGGKSAESTPTGPSSEARPAPSSKQPISQADQEKEPEEEVEEEQLRVGSSR
jgi:hypothetical protein